MTVKYKGATLGDFDDLLNDRYPTTQFKSPKRSTVPLIAFWKQGDNRQEFFSAIGVEYPPAATLSFEYEVESAKDCYPSCTDLMIEGDDLLIAVEAKYTEPLDETVEKWNLKHKANGERVLSHWLGIINGMTGRGISIRQISDIPYQFIHRLASACVPSESSSRRFLVYQWFTDKKEDVGKYTKHLSSLLALIGNGGVQVKMVVCPMRLEQSPEYAALIKRWNEGERDLSKQVVAGLRKNDFICFGKPTCEAIVVSHEP